MAVVGLRCCVGFSLVAAKGDYSRALLRGLLILLASLAVEHGL